MKTRRGWLTTLNEDTKKMIPFFVRVRSEDIEVTNPVDLSAALTQTSTRWTLTRSEQLVDVTYFRYTANWADTEDPNAEAVGCEFIDAYLDYYLYNDGRMEVDGIIRAKGTFEAIDEKYGIVTREIYLPFAFEETPVFDASYAYGSCSGITTAASVTGAQITNQHLNMDMVDTDEYNFLLNLTSIAPLNAELDTAVPITKVQSITESNEAYKDAEYIDYVNDYFPIHVHFNGYWRSHESVIIGTPESRDSTLTGTYKTTGAVNMYAEADTTSDKVRSLPAKTEVHCSGYYTDTVDGRFLFVSYTPTAQTGFIDASYLQLK